MTNRPIQAVIFDLWETLIHDPRELARPRQMRRAEMVQAALSAHGIDCDGATILETLDATSATLTLLHDDEVDSGSRGRVELFLANLPDDRVTGLPDKALDAIEEAITMMPPELAPLLAPHAVETVSALKALGLKTGLISNAGFTTAPALRWMLDHYGVGPHLDVLVFSDEHRLAKPHPRLFAAAVAELGCAPGACVFVGDSPHNDVFGAQRAGLAAVQIGDKRRDGVRPDARIGELDELIPALRELGLLS